MSGGAGSDQFYYQTATDSDATNTDEIRDFSHAESDHIGLSQVYSGTLTFIGSSAFSGAAGEVRVISGPNEIVLVNLDTDLAAEMRIVVTSATALEASDFFL